MTRKTEELRNQKGERKRVRNAEFDAAAPNADVNRDSKKFRNN
jgi:hypothetical protein